MSVPTCKSSVRLYSLFRDSHDEQPGQMLYGHKANRACVMEFYQTGLSPRSNSCHRNHQTWLSLYGRSGCAAEHFLAWGQQLSLQLQTCHDRVALRNYSATTNERVPAEVRRHSDEVLSGMPPSLHFYEMPFRFASLDAIECHWCFASSNMDVHESCTKISPQGALS